MKTALDFLFNPRSIALIGAAHSEEKLGGILLKNLLKYKGRIYPVNPKYKELMGHKAYASLSEVPEEVDLSVIMRPAPEVPGILREHKGRAKSVIIVSSGFSEVGEDELQEEIRRTGKEAGLRMLGPNCMGVYNPYSGLDTFFLPPETVKRPKKGNVAIVSQSGAFLHCIFGIMRNEKIGISRAVTYGNAVDIDETDLYEYLGSDKQTGVVVSYIESVGDGRKFVEAAQRLSRKKSLIVLKSGKGTRGQAAAYSHTGRLAGSYEVFTSILRQFDIREAEDFDEMTDTMKALSFQKQVTGNKVLIITNGGGSGVLAADECMRQGLEVAPLPEAKKANLKKKFPSFYGVHNPVDLTAQVTDADYGTALKELKDDYDGFLIIALTGLAGITESLADIVKDFRTETEKPLIFHTSCGCGAGMLVNRVERAGIPVYLSPERAVRGLRALLR